MAKEIQMIGTGSREEWLELRKNYIGGSDASDEEGLRVPEDISVAGYDGIHMAKMVSPRLTTWQQNTPDLGRIAAEQLVEQIEHPRTTPPKHITVQGQLLEGETVRQLDE